MAAARSLLPALLLLVLLVNSVELNMKNVKSQLNGKAPQNSDAKPDKAAATTESAKHDSSTESSARKQSTPGTQGKTPQPTPGSGGKQSGQKPAASTAASVKKQSTPPSAQNKPTASSGGKQSGPSNVQNKPLATTASIPQGKPSSDQQKTTSTTKPGPKSPPLKQKAGNGGNGLKNSKIPIATTAATKINSNVKPMDLGLFATTKSTASVTGPTGIQENSINVALPILPPPPVLSTPAAAKPVAATISLPAPKVELTTPKLAVISVPAVSPSKPVITMVTQTPSVTDIKNQRNILADISTTKPPYNNIMNFFAKSQLVTSKGVAIPAVINCEQQNFVHMNDCCKRLPHDFFSQDSRWQCYGSHEGHYASQATREYILNKWQQGANVSLHLAAPRTRGFLEHMKCFAECMFAVNNLILPNNNLNINRISAQFMAATAEESRPQVVDAVNVCSDVIRAHLPAAQVTKCSPLAFVFMQCLRKEILMSCTLPVIPKVSPRSKDKKFELEKKYAEMCDRRSKILKMCDAMKAPED